MTKKPIAQAAFDQLAEDFAARAETKPHNAYYDRPAVYALLPDVAGQRVLDAGCGPGIYAAWLVEHGAEVVGLDVSAKMRELAERRLQGKARIIEADLSQPLDFLAAESFDLVVSALALDYVRDWHALFKEFFRVLRVPGHFVFSVGHPADEFYDHHPTGNYFEIELVEVDWKAFGQRVPMPYYRRPLSAMVAPLLAAGFSLERLVEPRPVPEFANEDPQDYAKLMRQPGFICFRARKESAGK
jgi:SAM-dependent methyltransferase